MTELICGKYGTVPASPVVIYATDSTGALVPKTAQCRDGCTQDTPRSARTRRRNPFPSNRRGKCGPCGLPILEGDLVIRVGDNSFAHVECPRVAASEPE